MKALDLEGKIFGNLTVVRKGEPKVYAKGNKSTTWVCVCSCGKQVVVATSLLGSGSKRSCGCLNFKGPHGNRKRSPKESSWISLLNRMRNVAKKRNIEWDLDPEDWKYLVSQNCRWCGDPPSQKFNYAKSQNGYTQRKNETEGVRNGWILFNGLDRRDSHKGYHLDNLQPCCKWCNFARNEMSEKDFLSWVQRIAEHALGFSK